MASHDIFRKLHCVCMFQILSQAISPLPHVEVGALTQSREKESSQCSLPVCHRRRLKEGFVLGQWPAMLNKKHHCARRLKILSHADNVQRLQISSHADTHGVQRLQISSHADIQYTNRQNMWIKIPQNSLCKKNTSLKTGYFSYFSTYSWSQNLWKYCVQNHPKQPPNSQIDRMCA